jgi:putative NIF3 family GTP cyclohydrolase 1 type 2
MIKLLLNHNIAVYSSHLPLDANPKIGNNIILCKKLGLKKPEPFLNLKGQSIGFKARCFIKREELTITLSKITGHTPVLIPFGPEICKQIGVVSGGAGSELNIAAQERIDTYITGRRSILDSIILQKSQIQMSFTADIIKLKPLGLKL